MGTWCFSSPKKDSLNASCQYIASLDRIWRMGCPSNGSQWYLSQYHLPINGPNLWWKEIDWLPDFQPQKGAFCGCHLASPGKLLYCLIPINEIKKVLKFRLMVQWWVFLIAVQHVRELLVELFFSVSSWWHDVLCLCYVFWFFATGVGIGHSILPLTESEPFSAIECSMILWRFRILNWIWCVVWTERRLTGPDEVKKPKVN